MWHTNGICAEPEHVLHRECAELDSCCYAPYLLENITSEKPIRQRYSFFSSVRRCSLFCTWGGQATYRRKRRADKVDISAAPQSCTLILPDLAFFLFFFFWIRSGLVSCGERVDEVIATCYIIPDSKEVLYLFCSLATHTA